METILIIDDDPAIGDLEQEVLQRAGYAVRRAYCGTEARLLPWFKPTSSCWT